MATIPNKLRIPPPRAQYAAAPIPAKPAIPKVVGVAVGTGVGLIIGAMLARKIINTTAGGVGGGIAGGVIGAWLASKLYGNSGLLGGLGACGPGYYETKDASQGPMAKPYCAKGPDHPDGKICKSRGGKWMSVAAMGMAGGSGYDCQCPGTQVWSGGCRGEPPDCRPAGFNCGIYPQPAPPAPFPPYIPPRPVANAVSQIASGCKRGYVKRCTCVRAGV